MKKDRLKKFSLFLVPFFFWSIIFPAVGRAAPAIPGFYGTVTPPLPPPCVNALPVLKSVVQGAFVPGASNNRLVIHQNQPKAIINWESFNIGENASTHFNQQGNADWAALNRIFDRNPSQIFGALTADGKIYLINQNGILFSPTSKVNVHSLVASSLNITNDDFLNGLLKFKAENYNSLEDNFIDVNSSVVSNHGVIETDESGSVFFLAPTVENSGVIITPIGQIGLAAGTEVDIPHYADGYEVYLDVKNPGEHGFAVNFENGWLIADTGLAGMYGRIVNQEGLIRSVTAIKKQGRIELLASEKVSTGANSVTITPVSASSETAHQSFEIREGEITIDGGELIEHRGIIYAPSGVVNLNASERVYLEKGSVTDVSGMWVDKSGEANFIEAQLNTVQLRDDYGQKGGLLQGETITASALAGSAIGDISGHLVSEEMTALERSTEGGIINISASSGDIIVKEGAMIDFSGGRIRYGEGNFQTTKLLAGDRIYDISEAPQWIQYDKILGYQEKRHKRYGITEEYEGLYYGGANPLMDYMPGHVEGSNAGLLTLIAKRIILDGEIRGSAFQGIYQTEGAEPMDDYNCQWARGLRQPAGGTLIIGDLADERAEPPDGEYDFVLDNVVVKSEVEPVEESFGADPDDFPYPEDRGGKTYLSASILNNAGLSNLEIYTNGVFKTEENARIILEPGNWQGGWKDNRDNQILNNLPIGRFHAVAGSILHQGEINVPAGHVKLMIRDITNDFSQTNKQIFLADGSKIIARGEEIDNSLSGAGGGEPLSAGHIHGGYVTIADETHTKGKGVFVMSQALVDVGGGYEMDENGDINGGDSGTLSLAGPTLLMEGDIRGHSLVGRDGGTIIMHANQVSVVKPSELAPVPTHLTPENVSAVLEEMDLDGKIVLAENRLECTGFSQVELRSVSHLSVEDRVILEPSRARRAMPEIRAAGRQTGMPQNVNWLDSGVDGTMGPDGFIRVAPEYAGDTSVTLKAGQRRRYYEPPNILEALLTLKPGSKIHTAPGGTIEMKGPRVDVSGDLEARSGKVKLTATGTAEGYGGNLTFRTGSRILTAGYNKQQTEPLIKGLPAGFTPMPGGEVILETKLGDLIMESGALIDVSGSAPTTNFIRNSDGALSSVTVAGDPGSIELAYFNNMTLDGQLNAHAQMEGLRGGSLAINRSNYQDDTPLTIRADDINRYQADGFDALTFGSLAGLKFSGSMNLETGRSLTLNAPEIIGEDGQSVSLTAPWLRLANTREKYSGIPGLDPYDFIPGQAESGTGMITLSGEWLDIDGSVTLSKFKDVNLHVQQDIRLTDEIYKDTWEGMLKVPGDLTMTAARIYPATRSDFTIKSRGKVTTRRSESAPRGPVFSAGGSLTIEANKIEHRGVLAAPMGKINLYGVGDDSRVYLAEGSLVSTKGEGRVKYGTLGEIFWTIKDKDNDEDFIADGIAVENAPEKSVDISIIDNPEGEGEVIVREGAEIDTSGGGSVFSYKFLAGIEGSQDPLKKEGRYVILPDNSVSLPGEAVYLEGADGLPAGTYSLLPEEYAFVPGAMVITDLSMDVVPGESVVTEEGYTVVSGYATVMGTDIHSPMPRGYALRSAADVLKEGYFNIGELTAGHAGSVVINGPTTILDGTIKGDALPGYQGGLLSMSAAENAIVRSAVSLPGGFGFGDSIPGDLVGKCMITSDGLAGRGLRELNIGDLGTTDTITLEDGSILDAPLVTLSGKNSITLESGARIEAVGDGGTASLISPDGEVIIEENALVHASDAVNLETSNLTLEGEMKVDNSTLNLQGENISIVPDGYSGARAENTIYLTESLWGLTGFDNIGFISRNDLTFKDGINLEVPETLTIDAKRIAGLEFDGEKTSNITSQTINLLNTKDAFDGDGLDNDTCAVAFNADEMTIGHGDILFDGFDNVNFISRNDITFRGQGSLVSSGDLDITAARVTTSYYQDTETSYEVADFQVNAGNSAVAIAKSGGISGQTKIPGGILEFRAGAIDHSGIVDVTSGRVKFIATGLAADDDGIFLREGAEILARGCDYAPGGLVDLQTEEGVLDIEAGSLIDVSAGGQGDAGAISLYAPAEDVVLNGDIEGNSQGGRGGSFALDTKSIDEFSGLNTKLTQGGFNEEINIRARSGNVEIAADDTVVAHKFNLTVDKTEGDNDGNISLLGKIDASGDEGGTVELYAGNDLNLDGIIDAHSTGAGLPGGEVILSAAEGSVNFNQEAYIDVSAGHGAPLEYAEQPAQGGEVTFRALRGKVINGEVVAKGTVKGASRIMVEGVETYEYTGSQTFNSVSDARVEGWKTDANSFLTSEGSINTLFMGDDGLILLNREGQPDTDVSFLLLPGVDVRVRDGDLTTAFDWQLNSWLDNDKPGRLALRAQGNLNIEGNIIDSRTPGLGGFPPVPSRCRLFSNVPGEDSWGILLAAGADLQSADPLSVRELRGNLAISDKKVVYTENAPISFASGNDTTLLHGQQSGFMINDKMTYNLGTYRGSILGRVGGNLNIGGGGSQPNDKSGGIQTALGDIDIRVGENLNMEYDNYSRSVGIRTTGGARRYLWADRDNWPEYLDELKNSICGPPFWPDSRFQRQVDVKVHDFYHLYAQHAGRGDMALHIGGDVNVSGSGSFSSEAWDYEHKYNQWTACYKDGTWSGTDYFPVGGLATMAGGDLEVSAGGGFESKAGTFGKGDLSIFAGRDIDGKFLVRDGRGEIGALGNFGLDHLNSSRELEPDPGKTIEAFSAQIDVTAQGDVIIGEVLNPTTRVNSMFDSIDEVQLRYAEDTALKIRAVTGDVSLPAGALLPPIFDVEAAGDIYIETRLVLAPSRSGHLRLVAGGNIDGGYMTPAIGYTNSDIIIADIAPEAAYANYPKPRYVDENGETQIYKCKRHGGGVGKPVLEDRYLHGFPTNTGYGDQDYLKIYGEMMKGDMALIEDPDERAFFEGISDRFYVPVHAEDDKPVEIRAGRDIRNLNLFLPKKAEIKAGRDIRDIYYIGQNVNSEDVATIRASRDIFFSTAARNYLTGIEYGGPGFLLVQAGNFIDLGTTKGIQSIGNLYSPMLGSKGCSLVVISGSNKDIEPDETVTFFEQLRDAGVEYSNLLEGGDAGLALNRVEEARQEIIKPFFQGDPAGEGDIDMVRSQVMTAGSDSGIFVIARGDFNVGRSAFAAEEERENSGVLTESNGPINIFAEGDVNVFESRVMTMMGGDIAVWSDKGDINAGRGSKTTVSRGKPKMEWKNDHWEIQRKAVAVGSGIRTLTYDPDGFEGPLEPPDAGDAYLFAPEGIIDAGEAGIAAKNVILGATEVLNAQNIEVTGVSVGVPLASEGASGLGALAGAGSLAATSGLTEEMAGLDTGKDVAEGYSEPEDYTPTWLKVKVIGFDGED